MNKAVREPRSHGTLGSLRQFGSGLRAGFTVFLRKNRRVMVFLVGACPPKNDS